MGYGRRHEKEIPGAGGTAIVRLETAADVVERVRKVIRRDVVKAASEFSGYESLQGVSARDYVFQKQHRQTLLNVRMTREWVVNKKAYDFLEQLRTGGSLWVEEKEALQRGVDWDQRYGGPVVEALRNNDPDAYALIVGRATGVYAAMDLFDMAARGSRAALAKLTNSYGVINHTRRKGAPVDYDSWGVAPPVADFSFPPLPATLDIYPVPAGLASTYWTLVIMSRAKKKKKKTILGKRVPLPKPYVTSTKPRASTAPTAAPSMAPSAAPPRPKSPAAPSMAPPRPKSPAPVVAQHGNVNLADVDFTTWARAIGDPNVSGVEWVEEFVAAVEEAHQKFGSEKALEIGLAELKTLKTGVNQLSVDASEPFLKLLNYAEKRLRSEFPDVLHLDFTTWAQTLGESNVSGSEWIEKFVAAVNEAQHQFGSEDALKIGLRELETLKAGVNNLGVAASEPFQRLLKDAENRLRDALRKLAAAQLNVPPPPSPTDAATAALAATAKKEEEEEERAFIKRGGLDHDLFIWIFPPESARAKYDCGATKDDELKCKLGDPLMILGKGKAGKQMENWFWVRNTLDNKVGLVPANLFDSGDASGDDDSGDEEDSYAMSEFAISGSLWGKHFSDGVAASAVLRTSG